MGMESNRNQLANPHSHTHCQAAPADPQAKTWQRVCLTNRTTKTTDQPSNEKEHRRHNIGNCCTTSLSRKNLL
jgi:hypothetical protein